MKYINIENLIIEQNLDQAIEEILTIQSKNNDQSDEQLDLLLAKAYFFKNEFGPAKIILTSLMDYSSKQYFDVVYTLALVLIKLNEENKALELVEEELSQPYIPISWSEKFVDLKKELLAHGSNGSNKTTLSDEEVEEKLNSTEELDNLLAINFLQKHNIREFLSIINDFLIVEENSYKIKTLLVEALASQQVHLKLQVAKFGTLHEVDTTFINNQENVQILKELEEYITNLTDNISVVNFSKELFVHYYVHYFPVVKKEKMLYEAIYVLACEMLGEECNITVDNELNPFVEILQQMQF